MDGWQKHRTVPDSEVYSRDARFLNMFIQAALEPNVTWTIDVHQLIDVPHFLQTDE